MKILSSEVVGRYNGQEVTLQKIDDPHSNYRVDYRGGGHYFPDELTAVDYMVRRKMVPEAKWLEALKAVGREAWEGYNGEEQGALQQ